jgi:outer membrane protein
MPRATTLSRLLLAAAAVSPAVQAQEPASNEWRFSLGAAVASVPEFPGSDQQKTRAVPIFSATYGRYFLGPVPGGGPLGIGATLYEAGGLRLGAALSTDIGKLREESDDPRLAGLGDIERTQRAHLFASYGFGRYKLSAGVAPDIGGKDLGTLVSLEAEAMFQPADRWSLAVGPGLTWGNQRYMRTVFGIDAQQSARSGRATYDPGAGVGLVRVSGTLNYQLDANWNLGARVSFGRLQGDAADSPLVFDKSQASGLLYASYRF